MTADLQAKLEILPALSSTSCFKFEVTDVDRYAWSFFRLRTLPDVNNITPLGSWLVSALRLSLTIEPVFYAITAAATAHRMALYVPDISLKRHYLDLNRDVANRQYGRALSSLQGYISEQSQNTSALEAIVLTCMAFICFEVSMDREDNALAHLKFARRIVSEHLKQDEIRGRKGDSSAVLSTQLDEVTHGMVRDSSLTQHCQNTRLTGRTFRADRARHYPTTKPALGDTQTPTPIR
jgi:hypothetical protein